MRTLILLITLLFVGCGTNNESSAKTPTTQENINLETTTVASTETNLDGQELLALVNIERENGAMCGDTYYPPVAPLEYNYDLERSATLKSEDLATSGIFSHEGSKTESDATRNSKMLSFIPLIRNFYGSYSVAGENLAMGYDTPEALVKAWMKSPGHCQNIMRASYKEFGADMQYPNGSKYEKYTTTHFASK